MSVGGVSNQVNENRGMNPIAKGTAIGAGVGVAISGLTEAFSQKDQLKLAKDSFAHEATNLSKLEQELNSCNWPDYTKKVYEGLIEKSKQTLKGFETEIQTIKKSMPKEVFQGIAKSPVTYLAALVGLGVGVAVAHKNKNAHAENA